ncbi:B12-binding domain-containing radical SAM protein [Candidatus Omnitrophota bacterium]
MNLLLVIPLHRSYVIQPNLGLGYIASSIRKTGHGVTILDCVKDKINLNTFLSILRTSTYDIVGFHMFSQDYAFIKALSKAIKEINPKIYTIVGGPHPSSDPYGIIQDFPDIDFVFSGEGENAVPVLLNLLSQRCLDNSELSKIDGLYWKDRPRGQNYENSNSYGIVNDLDSLPFPAWDLMRPDRYPQAPHGAFVKQFPSAPIILTRGCSFQCTFCAGARHSPRKRSIGNVMEEIEFLNRQYGVKELIIEDENFTMHRKLLHEFCESLLNTDRGYTWNCASGIRLSCINQEDMLLMKKAGCHSVSVGIEFGSQRIFDLTRKGENLEAIREKIDILAKTDVTITGFFLLGIPGETFNEMKETIKFALSLPLHRVQINNFMPLPGSEIWENLKKDGKLKDIDYSHFFVHDVSYVSEGIKKTDIKQLQRKGYLKFYFRWKIIKRILSDIRSFSHLKYLIQRFFDALF